MEHSSQHFDATVDGELYHLVNADMPFDLIDRFNAANISLRYATDQIYEPLEMPQCKDNFNLGLQTQRGDFTR